ncbi:LacI family DNA-binding transcriptional regulator [Pseudoroseomonas wenyumeiae]|uniref:LacI family DNA-binding transcriptional regulator n=1 Tax=Teichococcus wenyumeiae TaxID=2478470 RepID=A0A3A9J7E6_9PROT|nr:LacI family DNA-binding transcriptional regulator [Pseudoroseomonas wenyumeiae]RKK01571.1 LacI family DNA-binding transcriptional regulator [Pseudoroseomonas wenyumeiae]RMI15090.1 LacI family DNA-binding transcriptional regulator [Pseudoroseomonas wenyumeiae]
MPSSISMPAPPDRVTVVTIARQAGVASSTVSRALNGDTRISAATRARIAAIALELGYKPDALARTLSGGRSGLVGLVLGPVENPFYVAMLQEVVAQAARRGIRLLVLHLGAGAVEDETMEAVLQYRVDGCLVTSAQLSSRIADMCGSHGVPVVMLNRTTRLRASSVSCDNLEGATEITQFLLHEGHRRFALVGTDTSSSTALEREQGFTRALASAGLEAVRFSGGTSSWMGGYVAGEGIAALPPAERPHAVFAVSDIMALGVIDALRQNGLRVPQDVSVVGFDDIAEAARPTYALTTMSQPLVPMVRRGLDMLLARMEDPALPDEVTLLRGTLAVRGSTQARVVA